MTPELEKVMQEWAADRANCLPDIECDLSVREFCAGFRAAIAHLEKQAGFFDGSLARQASYDNPNNGDYYYSDETFIEGARWQFERMKYSTQLAWEQVAADEDVIESLEARLAESESALELMGSIKLLCKEREDKLTAAEARIKEYSQLIRDKGIR